MAELDLYKSGAYQTISMNLDNFQSVPADFIDRVKAAKLLGVSPRTLNQLRTQDMGPLRFRIEGRVHYLIEDLRRWLMVQESRSREVDSATMQGSHLELIYRELQAKTAALAATLFNPVSKGHPSRH